jgi:hypothetical protein
MANLLIPRSIKKEMKGTRSVQNQKKKNQKGFQILTLRSRLGTHLPRHHRIRHRWILGRAPTTTACRQFCGRWVASDPPKGTTVDRIDGDALPLGSACADERIHDSAAALALRARRARSTESPPHRLPFLSLALVLARPRGGNGLGFHRGTAGHQFCFAKERGQPFDQDRRLPGLVGWNWPRWVMSSAAQAFAEFCYLDVGWTGPAVLSFWTKFS